MNSWIDELMKWWNDEMMTWLIDKLMIWWVYIEETIKYIYCLIGLK
jgi:hypothetical protein